MQQKTIACHKMKPVYVAASFSWNWTAHAAPGDSILVTETSTCCLVALLPDKPHYSQHQRASQLPTVNKKPNELCSCKASGCCCCLSFFLLLIFLQVLLQLLWSLVNYQSAKKNDFCLKIAARKIQFRRNAICCMHEQLCKCICTCVLCGCLPPVFVHLFLLLRYSRTRCHGTESQLHFIV